MVNITLSIPGELKEKMDSFPEINWSAVARSAIDERVKDLVILKKFKSESNLTEKDAIQLGRELNKNLSKRWKS